MYNNNQKCIPILKVYLLEGGEQYCMGDGGVKSNSGTLLNKVFIKQSLTKEII